MKIFSNIVAVLFLMLVVSCKDNDKPYVGYIKIGRVVAEAEGGTVSTLADTDISSKIIATVDAESSEWCEVTTNGKEIIVNVKQANPDLKNHRSAIVNVKCGYRTTSFEVLQKYKNQSLLEYERTGWAVSGSDVQSSDGGGYPSILTSDPTTFWHSQYSPALENPLPHEIIVDMKKELAVAKVEIGRRLYAGNGNYYPSVKTMEIYSSINKTDYTLVGSFTFALPWTAPDGTIVNGNSPLIPENESINFENEVNAKYFKLIITETNNTSGACQVSYFKAFEKL